MQATDTNRDQPLLGICLALGFCLVIPFSDALAKILGDRFPLLQLIEARFAAQALIFLPLTWWARTRLFRSTRATGLLIARTILQIAGLGAMFTALRFLPLADAVAIAFVMPFLILLLGHFALGEEVGPRRLGACLVGFAGTLMVVQPSFATIGWPALLPLAVAVIFALFTLATRVLSAEMDPITMQSGSALIGLTILLPLGLFELPGTPPPLGWIMPFGTDLWLLIALGVTGALGHLLFTASLRYAPAATIAPMQYLEIPIATLLGLVLFQQLPNGLAAAGIALTLAAGLYIVARERRLSRRAA
ncbi:MAG: DMT family transporter [Pseudomonadota bacterium]